MTSFPLPRDADPAAQGNVLKTHTIYIMCFEHIIGWSAVRGQVSP
jgi:hypothetical protein